ncbi:uncharacterized protein LOC124140667 [Haliotis rufescens]|uniref:uncharacterized protein LOC124140667 n=1 Tax=Haliotis rufescens TaxID=6454 RepID=UPI001EB083EC|nr:uncharacterized protein LOC124140667 [Haliotis rufescens]
MSESVDLEVPPSPGTPTPSPQGGKTGRGVVRKRSVRRCISTGKEEAIPLTYGRNREEYDKIVERVMSDKAVQAAVESLQERWKMIMIMHEDCMQMVEDWDDRQLKKAQAIDVFQLLIAVMIAVSVLIPVMCSVYKWG